MLIIAPISVLSSIIAQGSIILILIQYLVIVSYSVQRGYTQKTQPLHALAIVTLDLLIISPGDVFPLVHNFNKLTEIQTHIGA